MVLPALPPPHANIIFTVGECSDFLLLPALSHPLVRSSTHTLSWIPWRLCMGRKAGHCGPRVHNQEPTTLQNARFYWGGGGKSHKLTGHCYVPKSQITNQLCIVCCEDVGHATEVSGLMGGWDKSHKLAVECHRESPKSRISLCVVCCGVAGWTLLSQWLGLLLGWVSHVSRALLGH